MRDEDANVAWLEANGEEWDGDGLATLRRWDNYFRPDKERHHLAQQIPGPQAIESLQASIEPAASRSVRRRQRKAGICTYTYYS